MNMVRPVLDHAVELAAIARAVRQLSPSWQRPEQFHEQKSEIVGRLRALARVPDKTPWPPLSSPAPSPPRIVREVQFVTVTIALRPHLLRRSRHRYPRPPARCERQFRLAL